MADPWRRAAWGNANPLNMSEKSFAETVTIVQGIFDRVKPEMTKLVMETESYLLPDSPEMYARLIEAIDRPGFAVHLDPVNIIASPQAILLQCPVYQEVLCAIGSLDRELPCQGSEHAAQTCDRAN